MRHMPWNRWSYGLAVAAALSARGVGAQVTPGIPTPGKRPAYPGVENRGKAAHAPGYAESRKVCRGALTSGWIAIDYVEDPSTDCPKSKVYSTAVIVKYTALNVGDELQVCAPEPVPQNWITVSDNADSKRCPIEPDKSGESTVKTIRRVR